jgi:hypothetical protein
MINRLEISQRELEMTLRQISQQEMARQAAHEIKMRSPPSSLSPNTCSASPTSNPKSFTGSATKCSKK